MSEIKKESVYTNSVERAIDILEFIADCGRSTSVLEISKEFGVNRTSIYSILKILIAKGYIHKIEDGKYALTGRMFEYGQKFRNSFPVVHIARGIANELRTDYSCTLNIAMHFSGDHAVLMNSINISSSNDTYRFDRSMGAGQTFPLYATSMGKLLLAYMPPIESRDILQNMDFQPYTQFTVKNAEVLKKQMDFAVTNGYVIEENEFFNNTFCVAAPIFDNTNSVIAACSFTCNLNPELDKNKIIMDIKNVAHNISVGLGSTRRM